MPVNSHNNNPRYRQLRRRAGYTIMELLIVMSIAVLLMSMLIVVIGNTLTTARNAATTATILKIDGLLQQRIQAFRTALDTPQWQNQLKALIPAKKAELINADIKGVHEKMLEMLILKDQFRRTFPQTSADNSGLTAAGQPFSGNLANEAESAEYLFWQITQADSFGIPPVDESEFSSSEIGDTDGDGRREFIDPWGNPLRFYRWPTRLLRPGGPGATLRRDVAGLLMTGIPSGASSTGDTDPAAIDPDDRLGLYVSTVNSTSMTPAQYETLAHTPDTYWMPLIVSGGPDRETGLLEPYDSANFGNLARPKVDGSGNPIIDPLNDNLTNQQKQR